MVIIDNAIWLCAFIIVHWPELIRLTNTASIRSIDAVVCTRKYFVAASVDRGFAFINKMGIIANIFSSRPIQIRSQWELHIVIIVPDSRVTIIIIRTKGLI